MIEKTVNVQRKKSFQKACRSLQKSLGFEPRQSPSVKSLLVFSESQEFHFLVKIFKNVALVMGFQYLRPACQAQCHCVRDEQATVPSISCKYLILISDEFMVLSFSSSDSDKRRLCGTSSKLFLNFPGGGRDHPTLSLRARCREYSGAGHLVSGET